MFSRFTLNYGARFDVFNSSFDDENQLSPRINLIYQPTDSTTLHAGYSRYFTPPPVENVSGSDRRAFSTARRIESATNAGQSRQGRARELFRRRHHAETCARIAGRRGRLLQRRQEPARRRIVRADAHSFGVQLCAKAKSMAWNSPAVTRTADFPPTPTSRGRRRMGKDWNSAQFLFDPNDAAYVQNHWIYLDHDQRSPARSAWPTHGTNLRVTARVVYVDAIYGSGLRQDVDGLRRQHAGSQRRKRADITPSTSARNKVSKSAKASS